jgi:hypothetical protein
MANRSGVARRLVARAWEGAVCWRCLEPAGWAVVLVGLEGERVEYGHCESCLPDDLVGSTVAIEQQEAQDKRREAAIVPQRWGPVRGRKLGGLFDCPINADVPFDEADAKCQSVCQWGACDVMSPGVCREAQSKRTGVANG